MRCISPPRHAFRDGGERNRRLHRGGQQHKNITPAYNSGVNTPGTNTRQINPSTGKTRKVNANTRPCSRQRRSPATAARVDSRAPYRKNNNPIARIVACLHSAATMPRAGSNDATPTVVSSSRM
jgi:hypothetical protein